MFEEIVEVLQVEKFLLLQRLLIVMRLGFMRWKGVWQKGKSGRPERHEDTDLGRVSEEI